MPQSWDRIDFRLLKVLAVFMEDIDNEETRICDPNLDCRLLCPTGALSGLAESTPGALPHVSFGRNHGHPACDAVEGGSFPVGAPPCQALPQTLGGEQAVSGAFSPFSIKRVGGGEVHAGGGYFFLS